MLVMFVKLAVLESYTPDDEEDSAVAEVCNIWVLMGRYWIAVRRAQAGKSFETCYACSVLVFFVRCSTS